MHIMENFNIHSGRLLALVCWYVFSISQLNELHDIMSRQQKNHDVVLGAEFSDRDHRKGWIEKAEIYIKHTYNSQLKFGYM